MARYYATMFCFPFGEPFPLSDNNGKGGYKGDYSIDIERRWTTEIGELNNDELQLFREKICRRYDYFDVACCAMEQMPQSIVNAALPNTGHHGCYFMGKCCGITDNDEIQCDSRYFVPGRDKPNYKAKCGILIREETESRSLNEQFEIRYEIEKCDDIIKTREEEKVNIIDYQVIQACRNLAEKIRTARDDPYAVWKLKHASDETEPRQVKAKAFQQTSPMSDKDIHNSPQKSKPFSSETAIKNEAMVTPELTKATDPELPEPLAPVSVFCEPTPVEPTRQVVSRGEAVNRSETASSFPESIPTESPQESHLELLRQSLPRVPRGTQSKDGWIYVSNFAEMVGKVTGGLSNDRLENKGGRKTSDGLFGIDKNGYIWGKANENGKCFYRSPNEKPSSP